MSPVTEFGLAAAAAEATDADRYRDRRVVAGREGDVAGDVEAAIAAGSADALQHRAVAIVAEGGDVAKDRAIDRAGIAAAAAESAKAKADRAGRAAAGGNPAGDVESARAAAAAGRLHQCAERIVATGRDVAGDRRR